MICKSEWCEREVKEYDGVYAGGRSVSDVICSVVLSSRRNYIWSIINARLLGSVVEKGSLFCGSL